MKAILKELSDLFAILFGLYIIWSVLLLGLFGVGESYYFLDPYIDTRFAPDYTPEKFDTIEIGMHISDVRTLIGEPLSKYVNDETKIVIYYYTGDGTTYSEKYKGYGNFFAWYRSIITLDSSGCVISLDKGWSYY